MAGPVTPWWRGGTIYQVYPRSFQDSDGDGIGDLDGVAARLDHVASLGVDAIWLTPVNPSGGADGGYDVTDHDDVDPVYGGHQAFTRLIEAAHARGIRVVMDFVPNHTSDQHPWFVQSRADRTNPRRDWYVWADGRSGGTAPPNNWSARFFGPAWVRDEPTGQWYLASFYPEQPDLNWHNPEVRAAMNATLARWVELGVDGFRIDVIHRLAHDPELRDNPYAPVGGVGSYRPGAAGRWPTTRHVFDENGPQGHGFIEEMRRTVGDGTLMLGEVWLLDLREVTRYLEPGQLDLAFNFPFAMNPWMASQYSATIARTEELFGQVWPAWHLSNHDMPRHATRYGEHAVRAAAILLLTLRGTAVLYQGEEIGMVDGVVPPDRAVDRVGRDGCRTPVQWDGSRKAGFCPPGVEPWLPVSDQASQVNVAGQEGDPDSVLALYRRLLAARRRHPALSGGTYAALDAPPGAVVYQRADGQERFLVAVNMTSAEARVPSPPGIVTVHTSVAREGERVDGELVLDPDQAAVVQLDQVV